MKYYDNFLPENLAEELYNLGNNVMFGKHNEKVHFWTNYRWDQSIIKDSAAVICIQLPEHFLSIIDDILIKKQLLNEELDVTLTKGSSASINVWTKNSYIPTHKDGTHRKAITIYLTKDWNYNDGGLFNWKDKNIKEWYTVTPLFNRAVLNDDNHTHGTTPVTSDRFRITLQIFINKVKNT
jgi:Rps23 Pro-64 3,4-dihydroxylase Tpa1-like proline 4-hydroxylase